MKLIIGLVLLLITNISNAENEDVMSLLNGCRFLAHGIKTSNPDDAYDFAYCAGYFDALLDAYHTHIKEPVQVSKFCIPESEEKAEVLKKYIKLVELNPQLKEHNTMVVTGIAMSKNYPCND